MEKKLTILDKWRRKAFELIQTYVLKQNKYIDSKNMFISSKENVENEIRKIKIRLNETSAEIQYLDNSLKILNSSLEVTKKNFHKMNENEENSALKLKNIINIANKHLKYSFDVEDKRLDTLENIKKKFSMLPMAPTLQNLSEIQQENMKLSKELEEKQKKVFKREMNIENYKKLLESEKKLNTLKMQWNAISDEIEKFEVQSRSLAEAKQQYDLLLEDGRFLLEEKKLELKDRYDRIIQERNDLINKEQELSNLIDDNNDIVENKKNSAQKEIDDLTNIILEQNGVKESLTKKVATLESQLRFDKEVNTEKLKQNNISVCDVINTPGINDHNITDSERTKEGIKKSTSAIEKSNGNIISHDFLSNLLNQANNIYKN